MGLAKASQDFCPSCGEFVDQLDVRTGFCYECAGIQETLCMSCGKSFEKDAPHRKLCASCREERWLERHADEIEIYLSFGATIAFAKREVYHLNRPKCLSCGEPIKGGSPDAHFCTRNVECRRWRNRYRVLREKFQGAAMVDPIKMAISQVSAEIFAEHHRMDL